MAQRESPAADPRDAAAEDVELLAGDRLGGVGKEGEVDIGHVPMLAARLSAPWPLPLRASGTARWADRLRRGGRCRAVAASPAGAAGLLGERDVGQRHERLAAQDAGEVLGRSPSPWPRRPSRACPRR